jgi:MFS family permease
VDRAVRLLAVDYVAVAVVAFVALLVAGLAWIWALSTLNAALQLGLPTWVRARAVAFYLLVFQGGMALGAFVWGLIAQWAGLSAALVAAAALLVVGAVVSRWLPLRDRQVDPTPTDMWPEPQLVIEPAPQDGPVFVVVEYLVLEPNVEAFLKAMERVESSRRRTGPRPGAFIGTQPETTCSWRPSRSGRGRSTSPSTTSAIPRSTGSSRTRRGF